MRILMVYTLICVSILLGVPRFSIQNGSNCGLCHVNPTGGALRNDHGIEIVSTDELPRITDGSFYPDDYTGMINNFIRFGGDFRIQDFSYKQNENSDTDRYHILIPMQAEVYVYLSPSSALGLFFELDINPNGYGSEYWAILKDLPMNSWFKFGRSIPNYGLKLDDHTSFIRSGSISQNYGIQTNQLPFSPFIQKPLILELGISPNPNIFWTLSAGNNIYSTENVNENLHNKNITTQVQYTGTIYSINTLFSLQGMIDSDLLLLGYSNGLSLGQFTWESEMDWVQPDRGNGNMSLNAHHQLSWDIVTGITLTGLVEFIDPDLNIKSGSVTRVAFGLDYYPIPFLEIKFQARFHQLENININKPEPEYILQLHTWF